MNITDYTLLDWVGILSLIIGIIGLCYTISTNKAAKRIEKNVHDEKVKAVDRYRYNQEKRQYLNKAKYIREAVIRQNKLPQSTITFRSDELEKSQLAKEVVNIHSKILERIIKFSQDVKEPENLIGDYKDDYQNYLLEENNLSKLFEQSIM